MIIVVVLLCNRETWLLSKAVWPIVSHIIAHPDEMSAETARLLVFLEIVLLTDIKLFLCEMYEFVTYCMLYFAACVLLRFF